MTGELRIGIYHDISDLRAIRETLREKTGELDRFFTTGPDLLCILDTGGRFLRLNPAGEALLGCGIRTQDVLSLVEIVHTDDRAATRTTLHRMGRGGKLSLLSTGLCTLVVPSGGSNGGRSCREGNRSMRLHGT